MIAAFSNIKWVLILRFGFIYWEKNHTEVIKDEPVVAGKYTVTELKKKHLLDEIYIDLM